MTEWFWSVTPPAAGTGSELPPESLEWLGVDVLPSASSQVEKKEGETGGR